MSDKGCTSRIVLGDQGITYCPDCGDCECCTEGWPERHKDLDYRCSFVDDECIFKGNPNFPRHACQPWDNVNKPD